MVADENGVEYKDNDERAIFYARGVLETVKKLRWCPDIIHCQGWMSAFVPLYIKKAYQDEPSFRDSKVVFSVFEDDFKSDCEGNLTEKLMLKGIERMMWKHRQISGKLRGAVQTGHCLLRRCDTKQRKSERECHEVRP